MRPLSLLLLAACKLPDDQTANDSQAPSRAPDMSVAPARLDFGVRSASAGPASVSFVIRNDGDADLELHDLELQDPSGAFTLDDPGRALLAPGQSVTRSVRFEPTTLVNAASILLLHSNDPDEPRLELPLTGEGSAPVLRIDPADLDLGTYYLGCERRQPLTLSNAGDQPLTLSAVESLASSAELSYSLGEALNGPLPWLLLPGDQRAIEVVYRATDSSQDTQILTLESDDPAQPHALATQRAQGTPYGEAIDTWIQPSASVDLLFSVDTSATMAGETRQLLSDFQDFMRSLDAAQVDYRVAFVVDGETGCITGSGDRIDASLTGAEQLALATEMLGTPGTYPDATLRRLNLSLSAENTGSGGCNEGFLREDARLELVGISDEGDQSEEPWDAYLPRFQALKADSADLRFHAVAGDFPNGCGSAAAPTGLYEMAVATGGLFLSICSLSFESVFEPLVDAVAVERNAFELSATPVPETLIVALDGVQLSSGWSYAALDNQIRFAADATPPTGTQITVRYAVLGDCGS